MTGDKERTVANLKESNEQCRSSRVADYNRRLHENESDVNLWIEFIKFQVIRIS